MNGSSEGERKHYDPMFDAAYWGDKSVGPGRSDDECKFSACSAPVTKRYPGQDVPLCQKHVMLIWSLADDDLAAAEEIRARECAERLDSDPPRLEPGWVYYLRIDGHIKIGYAKHLETRLKAYPPTAQLVAVHSGTLADEQAIHRRFNHVRAAGREWYREDGVVKEHLDRVISEHGAPIIDPFAARLAKVKITRDQHRMRYSRRS